MALLPAVSGFVPLLAANRLQEYWLHETQSFKACTKIIICGNFRTQPVFRRVARNLQCGAVS